MSTGYRVPTWTEPLEVCAADVQARVAAVLHQEIGLDAETASRVAARVAHSLRLDCTELVEESTWSRIVREVTAECEAVAEAPIHEVRQRLVEAARKLRDAGDIREAGIRQLLTVAARHAGLDDISVERSLNLVLGSRRRGRVA